MFSVFYMFSMVFQLTSGSPIRDGWMEQLVEPCFLNTKDNCTPRCFFLCAKKVNIIERNMVRTKTWRIGQFWFEILCVLNITGLVCINGSIACKAHLFAKAVDFFFSCRNVYSDGVMLACGKRAGLPCGPPVFTARPSVQFEQVTKRRLNVTGEGSAEQGQRHREQTIDRIGSDLVVKQSSVKKHRQGE